MQRNKQIQRTYCRYLILFRPSSEWLQTVDTAIMSDYPYPNRPVYGRALLASVIEEYYKFLVRMYIPAAHLKLPPPEGWPSITEESTANMNKSKYVKSLIKHLPYISEESIDHDYDTKDWGKASTVHYKSFVVDYSAKSAEELRTASDWGETSLRYDAEAAREERLENPRSIQSDDEDDDDVEMTEDEAESDQDTDESQASLSDSSHATSRAASPDQSQPQSDPNAFGAEFFDDEDRDVTTDHIECDLIDFENIITLATGQGTFHYDLCLDVLTGHIYMDSQGSGNMYDSVEIHDFFADLQKKFETLKYVPVPGPPPHYNVFEGVPETDEEVDLDDLLEGQNDHEIGARQFRNIYRDFGWPGAEYDKDGCLAAIRRHSERREEANARRERE